MTQADLKAANDRSIRAIKQGTSVWNSLGKYLAADGTRISLQTPRISQQAGTGDKGLPTGTIKDGAVTEGKLSSGVKAQLNEIYTAAVLNTPGAEPSLVRGKGATVVTRTTGLPVGAFDLAFGANDISQCTWTASVGTVQPGAFTPVFGAFIPYTTLLNNTTLRVFTFNDAGALADGPFQVHVIC
ncbi:MAG: hypothetical protein OER93_03435 [Thermoleophilia bacterium]|nr:hypothetical protein [Thermoleophilia bacterium]